jgi:hypothetical protein
MYQKAVESLRPAEHLGQPLGLGRADQDVAHRAHEQRPRPAGPDRVEQWQQLEAHLPAAEGKHLEHDEARPPSPEGLEQVIAPPGLERLVDRPAPGIEQHLEVDAVALHGLELDELGPFELEPLDRQTAGDQGNPEAGPAQRAHQGRRPGQMADAEEMLDPEEHIHRLLRGRSFGGRVPGARALGHGRRRDRHGWTAISTMRSMS